jgi:hypothetical protein
LTVCQRLGFNPAAGIDKMAATGLKAGTAFLALSKHFEKTENAIFPGYYTRWSSSGNSAVQPQPLVNDLSFPKQDKGKASPSVEIAVS